MNGGRVEFNEKDTTIRVFDLEPYTNYLVTLDGTSFDNIAWRIRNKNLSVAIDPNKFKMIEVPIAVVGEANGTVYLEGSGGQKGQGRIIVNFYRRDLSLAASTLTEADGYFSFLGLLPGDYLAGIDTTQMNKLQMNVMPKLLPLTIEASSDGDVADGLEFVLRQNRVVAVKDTVARIVSTKDGMVTNLADKNIVIEQSMVKDNTYSSGESTLYSVQLLALRKPIKVREYFTQLLAGLPGQKIYETLGKDGLHHYSVGKFSTKSDAVELMRIIIRKGWKDCFVILGEEGRSLEVTLTPHETLYKVQLLALGKQVSIKECFAKLQKVVPGLTISETFGNDGLYRYSTTVINSKAEAVKLLRITKENGWKDSFITTQ